jgi:hypothetical protein
MAFMFLRERTKAPGWVRLNVIFGSRIVLLANAYIYTTTTYARVALRHSIVIRKFVN